MKFNLEYKLYSTKEELKTAQPIISGFYTKETKIIAGQYNPSIIMICYNNDNIVGYCTVQDRSFGASSVSIFTIKNDDNIEYGLLNNIIITIYLYPKYSYINKLNLICNSSDNTFSDTVKAANKLGFTYISRGLSYTEMVYKIDKTKSFAGMYNTVGKIFESYEYQPTRISEEYKLSELGVQTKDNMIFFNENTDERVLQETNKANNSYLKKLLYDERIKNSKQIFEIYKHVKETVPVVKYTYLDYALYKEKNIFIDFSYYMESFFKNNLHKLDKGVNLYFDFINRFLEDKRLDNLNYKRKTVFIPLMAWYKGEDSVIWDYKESINPISTIFRLIHTNPTELKTKWGIYDFIIFTDNGYFKLDIANLTTSDLNKIKTLITKLINKEPIEDDTYMVDSPKAISTEIIDRIETNNAIKINNLTGKDTLTNKEIEDIKNTATVSSDKKENSDKKSELIEKINKAATSNSSTDEAIDQLEDDTEIKALISDIQATEDNSLKVSATRSARMIKLNQKFLDSKHNGVSVRSIIGDDNNVLIGVDELPETSLPIDSINDEWKHLKFINMNKVYNIDNDILDILYSFSKMTIPISIVDYEIEDTTNSENFINTWTVHCEDYKGQRFTLKFDIPKLKDNRFMKLGGNDKTIQGQLMNLPIIKTDDDTCQVVSNYNKIFIRRFGASSGKSYPVADRIMKTLNKYKGKEIKVTAGDNSRICAKYDLPFDYIDLATSYSKIEIITQNKLYCTIYFNQDELREKIKVDDTKGIPIGITYANKVIYYNGTESLLFEAANDDSNICTISDNIFSMLCTTSDFLPLYQTTTVGTRYSYSKASILNTEIPIIVICAYNEGLTKVLKKANIKYEFIEKRTKYDKNTQDMIPFKDGYLYYKLNYESVLLMNGLKECNTSDFNIKEIDNKVMWMEFLDIFGGRLKADGLDNFYDLMVDPKTRDVCIRYNLPYDYVEMLIYASNLIADNKFNRHVDISGNRYRSTELIAGYTYKCIAKSYADYRNMLKRTSRATMTIKQSAIIDALMEDPTESDLSTINELNFIESTNAVSFKGLSGLNSERAYGLDKRTYDDSMVNVLGMSTGFAANVGVTRQATIDMNIDNTLGCIKTNSNSDDMSITKTFSMTEALTPFGCTRDDPFRTAMTFIQTAKHSMRVKHSDPPLITNGSDEALPYMTPDVFSYKSKGVGKVTEKTEDYMVVTYTSGKSDFIDLTEQVCKNSDGGFYVVVKLDTELKLGDKVAEKQILAFDKKSYSTDYGPNDNPSYEIGTLCKVAIFNSAEGYEDSTCIGNWLSEASTIETVEKKDISLSAKSNVYNIAAIGTHVQEGDPLLYFQNAFDDEDANILLRNLTLSDGENSIAELGRIPIKSGITGIIQDIKVYRTVEIEELSESLQKLVKKYENKVSSTKKIIAKYDKELANEYKSDYKLDATGKLKNVKDGVLIEFYLKYTNKAGIGDKFVVYSALKGVVRDVFPIEDTPTSTYRPDEDIDIFLAIGSVNRRMVSSIKIVGTINKAMVELDRHVKDIMGVKQSYKIHE